MWPYHAQLLRGISLPEADVHLVRATHDVLAVRGPLHTDNVLHSLCVIHFPAEEEILKQISLTTVYQGPENHFCVLRKYKRKIQFHFIELY